MSSRLRLFISTAILFAVAVPCSPASLAQSATTLSQEDSTGVSVQQIESELERIGASQELDDAQKAALKEMLGKAKGALNTAKTEGEAAQQFEQAAATAADQTKSLGEQAEEKTDEPTIAQDASVESLSQRLAAVKADLLVATTKATEAAKEPARRRARLTEMPVLLDAAERELADAQSQLAKPAPANESPIESSARELLAKARIEGLKATVARLTQEESAYIATSELLPLEQALLDRQVERLGQEARLLQEAIATKQSEKARETTAALQRTTSEVPQRLRQLAKMNLELAQMQSRLLSESSEAQATREAVEAAVEEVKSELKTSESRVEAVGLTDALGLMFRERRQDFEALRYQYRPKDGLKEQIQKYQIDSFRLEDELDYIKQDLSDVQAPEVDWESEEIDWTKLTAADARWVILRKRQKLIDETLETQNDVLQTVLINDTHRRQLTLEIERFNVFVDTHLFWTRSAPAFSLAELNSAPATLGWMTNPVNWNGLGRQMLGAAGFRPLQSLALVLLVLAMLYARPRFRRTIAAEGKEAHRFSAQYRSTFHALAATIGAAAAWPVFFAVLGFLCMSSSTGNPFVQGIGYAFGATALFVASRELLKEVCRNEGLAEAHFGWGDEMREYLKRHLRWYTLLGGLAIFSLVLYHEHPDTMVRTFSTRVSTTLLFLITAVFHHVMLRKRSPIYAELVRSNPDSVIYRWQKLLWVVFVSLPLIFGLMSLSGYLETTYRLVRSMQSTFFLLVIVVVVLGLISRWLTLQRRDITRRNAYEARERRLAAGNESETSTVANEAGIVLEDETQMDLPKLGHQARQTAFVLASLVAIVGLAFIWSDLVPAVAYFDEIELWSVGTGENIENVSLRDLVYSLLLVIALFFAVRNFPSVLELLVLSRTKLDGGARYAITTLFRYVLIVAGGFILLNLLSLPYHQLGWLVAAASVGLGFGLQEVVANFVSGVILLLERPVRIGDVVTIDGTTGIVSRIQMRATTVTNWDRKELIIPNKDLITQKILNWSLSNVVNRLTINIGVAYGSDVDLVRKILTDVVTNHPEVLDDPPPLINFETFGDSSLNFVVRFFLPKLDNRIEVTHQMNTAISEALAKADISIPFPQRDIRIIHESTDET